MLLKVALELRKSGGLHRGRGPQKVERKGNVLYAYAYTMTLVTREKESSARKKKKKF